MLTGLDRLLAEPSVLEGRRYGFLGHQASITSDLRPAHLALSATGSPPACLFGPEHGYYAVEQDMVAAADSVDPLTGLSIRSLYGDSEASLRPRSAAFEGLDLLVVDLQDIGARYYTYAATAVWAAEVAQSAGIEVWVLDRPNPLGGVGVEGNLLQAGFESFVGAFPTPVRHGLTLGELVSWRLDSPQGLRVWTMEGWEREHLWTDARVPFVAPSPNMPSFEIEVLYPGLCLVEGTTVSEGRGTTRPFRLVGAPWIDVAALRDDLSARELPGVRLLPTFFRPQFQKHAGEVCAGLELVVTDARVVPSYRLGIELLCALHAQASDRGVDLWRREAYEFVTDRPAIDLLCGTDLVRRSLDDGDAATVRSWVEGWSADEASFVEATSGHRLYPGS